MHKKWFKDRSLCEPAVDRSAPLSLQEMKQNMAVRMWT